jgi:hypothetical protein
LPKAIARPNQPMLATAKSTHDGHGTQFELRLTKGVQGFPPGLLKSIRTEAQYKSALYVDSFRVEGNDIVISFCRGGLVLAKVDHHWNSARKDEKYLVILREDRDEGDDTPIGREINKRLTDQT